MEDAIKRVEVEIEEEEEEEEVRDQSFRLERMELRSWIHGNLNGFGSLIETSCKFESLRSVLGIGIGIASDRCWKYCLFESFTWACISL